jgi:hypothetical protein
MSTSYNDRPKFEDRIAGAELIVIGKIKEIINSIVDHSAESPQVQTIFSVEIDKFLKGQIEQNTINLRVVGGKMDDIETKWSIPIKKGKEMLLMLSQDYQPEGLKDQYVPYFCSCYESTGKDEVKLDKESVQELSGKKINIEKSKSSLKDLSSLIRDVAKKREKNRKRLADIEPKELLNEPYGEVKEVPQPTSTGGGYSSSPQKAPDQED